SRPNLVQSSPVRPGQRDFNFGGGRSEALGRLGVGRQVERTDHPRRVFSWTGGGVQPLCRLIFVLISLPLAAALCFKPACLQPPEERSSAQLKDRALYFSFSALVFLAVATDPLT
ncbi:hypothetical protein FOMPIDRAFT_160435, partial [Fomitopsis schrenkii]